MRMRLRAPLTPIRNASHPACVMEKVPPDPLRDMRSGSAQRSLATRIRLRSTVGYAVHSVRGQTVAPRSRVARTAASGRSSPLGRPNRLNARTIDLPVSSILKRDCECPIQFASTLKEVGYLRGLSHHDVGLGDRFNLGELRM